MLLLSFELLTMVLDLRYINYLKDNRKVFLGCSSFNNKCVLCAPGKGLQRGALITLAEVGRVTGWVSGKMASWELQRGLRGYHAGLVLEQVYETLGFQLPPHPADEGLDQGISHDWAACPLPIQRGQEGGQREITFLMSGSETWHR